MKVQDYSIVDQLRKTSAQISLLPLLLNLDEHYHVLIKILNEAHVSLTTTLSQLEKMAKRLKVNKISFSNEEFLYDRVETIRHFT